MIYRKRLGVIPAFVLSIVTFVAGYALAGNLASKTIKLYVESPGEYLLEAPGGNFVSAMSVGMAGAVTVCEYLEEESAYLSRVPIDAALGGVSIGTGCLVTFASDD